MSVEDAEAIAREHGDFMAMRMVGDLFEPLPAKVVGEGDALFLHIGQQVFAMKRQELLAAIEELRP